MNQNTLLGIMIPFAGTALGSAMVFFMRKEMNDRLQKLLLGFASGVMIAASVWSLLIPAIEMAEQKGGVVMVPACGRIPVWNGISAPAGHSDAASPFYRRETGRPSVPFKKNNHACPCGHAS